MPLSDYSGQNNFTIRGSTFRRSGTSGGENVYERLGGSGSSGSSGPGDVTFINGEVSGAVIIDDALFLSEGDGGGANNHTIAQYTWPDMRLVKFLCPVPSGSGAPITPGASAWNDGEIVGMIPDYYGSDGTTVDIYWLNGQSLKKFTYNRSTKQATVAEHVDSCNGASLNLETNGWTIGAIRTNPSQSGKPTFITRKIIPASNSVSRTVQSGQFVHDGTNYKLTGTNQWLPALHGANENNSFAAGVTFTTGQQDNTYYILAGINPWTGRVYYVTDGLGEGIETFQIDSAQQTNDGNWVGAYQNILSTSGQSASGKIDFISNHRLTMARSATDDVTSRVRYDILFDIDTQLPSYVFAPGRRGNRDPKFGSLTKWNTAWT